MREVHVPLCLTRLTRFGMAGICDVPASARQSLAVAQRRALLGRRDRVHVGQMRKMRRLQRACQNTEPRMDLPNLAGSEG